MKKSSINLLTSFSKSGKRKTDHKINKKIFLLQKNHLSLNLIASGDTKTNRSKRILSHHSLNKKILTKLYKRLTNALNKFLMIYSSTEK